ncbi:hypothetical protein [Natrinema ejinorense]|uniref:Uncharacterized protein n=1 Tax=Natrinema ejinorense TaxID=373386 RepID=A0A2A5QRG4_9EURY|nr:hypothetical protein [Natrinema ejinorense]PCR89441.1 hypothetical protein CP557_02145 [Natrinema ejinorense]
MTDNDNTDNDIFDDEFSWDDEDTEAQKIEAAETAGDSVAAVLYFPIKLLLAFFAKLIIGISRRIPGRSRIQKGLIKSGIEGLWKTTDANLIVMTIYGDGVAVPRPAQVNSDEGKVETANGEEWTLTDISTVRIGKAPVAFGVADDHELASPVAARVAEAVDSDWRRVKTVQETADGISPTEYTDPQTTVADGGESGLREPFDDVWVDARNPLQSTAGWIVSMDKAYELHWSQSSSEEMKMQETRGRLAEMDPEAHRGRAIRMVIIAIGCFALGLLGPALASRIAGTAASDGGGSAIPIMINLVTSLGVI